MRAISSRCEIALALFTAACLGCGGGDGEPRPIEVAEVWHLERGLALVDGALDQAALAYLARFGAELGLEAEQELALISVRTGRDGLRHARAQQLHRGVPVIGAVIVAHADDSTFLGYNGTVARHLDGLDVTAATSAEQAVGQAKRHLEEAFPGAEAVDYGREEIQLAIQPFGGGADLVWRVELFTESQPRIEVGLWQFLIDARTGEVLEAYNGLNTAEQASGPGGNPKVSRAWSAALDVTEHGGQYAMLTDRLVTIDLNGDTSGGEVVRGPLDPIGDPALNDAHGFAELTLAMMRDWVGRNSIDDAGFLLRSRVHYDEDLDNAFWNGEEMTYGDGGDKFHALSGALDIVAHEIHHGFTEFHSGLIYKKMSGGLNESFSDIAGTMAEYYAEGDAGDMMMGEDAYRGEGGLRDLCDPTSDGKSIDHASDFDSGFYIKNLIIWGTGVHYSSGVGNKAFCLAVSRQRAATGSSVRDAVRRMGSAWFEANASYWTPDTSFSQGCQGVVDAARALGFSEAEVTQIHQSWADVGVYCESGGDLECDADGVCDVVEGETCASCAIDCGSCTEKCGRWKKAKCKLGIGDCSRCTGNSGCGDGVCGEDESDETCGQDCGCRAPGDHCTSWGPAPFGCYCDALCEENGDCCSDAEICQ